jgi:hypothetical protein
MVCPGRSSFGLGEIPQDRMPTQSPRMKQAVADRSSSVSPPRRKLTGGTDRAGYAPKQNAMSIDTPASDCELGLTRLIDAPPKSCFEHGPSPRF